jgi:hypothetical protein
MPIASTASRSRRGRSDLRLCGAGSKVTFSNAAGADGAGGASASGAALAGGIADGAWTGAWGGGSAIAASHSPPSWKAILRLDRHPGADRREEVARIILKLGQVRGGGIAPPFLPRRGLPAGDQAEQQAEAA